MKYIDYKHSFGKLMLFAILGLVSQLNVMAEDLSRKKDWEGLPYYVYHYSECKSEHAFLDSLLDFYDEYSIEQRVQIMDFIVDTFLTKDRSFTVESFIQNNVREIPFTKRQKDKLMEITLKTESGKLIDFWGLLGDESYMKPLHDWYMSHPESAKSDITEKTLFRLGDEMIVEKWISFLESEPAKGKDLEDDYFEHLRYIVKLSNSKKIFRRLFDIMLKYPKVQMKTDYAYPCCKHVYEPISMFFYHHMAYRLKDAPKYDYKKMKTYSYQKDNVTYYNIPDEVMKPYLDWCKKHRNDFELEE